MTGGSGSRILVRGLGAVSPAGWGLPAFRDAVSRSDPIAPGDFPRPGRTRPLRVRRTPAPTARPSFLNHARLRRTSPIAQYTVAAVIEALGDSAKLCGNDGFRLGIISCAMSGCVNYSRRFYDEVLKEPATASPLVFPETVYNSPASHAAAVLGTTAINYTLVGDPGTFLQGVALAADWLVRGRADGVVVVGAEELDWLTSDAMRLFHPAVNLSDGAGAIFLRYEPATGDDIELRAITNPHLYRRGTTPGEAARQARAELPALQGEVLLCDGFLGVPAADRDEESVWHDWTGPRLSPKKKLGEGLMAGAAWQCIAAVDALRQNNYDAACVSVVGCNEQAIAAQFARART